MTEGGRRTGKTKALVLGLKRGSIVIVHNTAMVDYLRNMIRELRGNDFALSCRVRCIYRASDVARTLAGESRPVAVDHAFFDFAASDAIAEVVRLAALANERAGNVGEDDNGRRQAPRAYEVDSA